MSKTPRKYPPELKERACRLVADWRHARDRSNGGFVEIGEQLDVHPETLRNWYKTELIEPRRPWRTVDDVEYATFEYVDWFNNRRLHSEIGNIPPIEAEDLFYNHQPAPTMGPDSAVRSLY